MNAKGLIQIVFSMVFLGGCTLAPDYQRPASPVPPAWPSGAAYREAEPPGAAPPVDGLTWQEAFPDPQLQQVIKLALENNRDLRVASLNVERARALYGVQKYELLPAVQAVGSGAKSHVPADLSSSGSARTSESYSVGLGISSWEVDFFGRIRSLKDSALEEYLATDEARRAARLLLVSSVAQAYFGLAADRETLKTVAETLASREASYQLVRKQVETGLTSELELAQARSLVDAARGEVARLTQAAAQDVNALTLLAGAPVPENLLPAALAGITPPREITVPLSSELLLKRPDILATEHQLKSANANIGAARAAFFPRISLTTAFGTASAELSGLFKAGSDNWSFAPAIALPIFDARTWSAYDATKAAREIAVAQYEKAIQSAFREVADALAARGTVTRQIEAQRSLVGALAEACRLAEIRYRTGIDGYLGLLDAQRSLYAAQQGLIALDLAGQANRIALYRVLGGGP